MHYAAGYCNAHWRRWRKTGDPGPAEIKRVRNGRVPCIVEGCERESSARERCGTHYARLMRGIDMPAAIKAQIPATRRDEHGNKQCSACYAWKPVSDFPKQSKTGDGLSHHCWECKRSRTYRVRYGITLEQYRALEAAQGGGCAICGGKNQGGRALSVDHDHSCCPGFKACGKCVRALLCGNCNAGLGVFKEDVRRLESAVQYLLKYAS